MPASSPGGASSGGTDSTAIGAPVAVPPPTTKLSRQQAGNFSIVAGSESRFKVVGHHPCQIDADKQIWRRMTGYREATPGSRGKHIVLTAFGDHDDVAYRRVGVGGAPLSWPNYCRQFNYVVDAKYKRDRSESRDRRQQQLTMENALERDDCRRCLPTFHGGHTTGFALHGGYASGPPPARPNHRLPLGPPPSRCDSSSSSSRSSNSSSSSTSSNSSNNSNRNSSRNIDSCVLAFPKHNTMWWYRYAPAARPLTLRSGASYIACVVPVAPSYIRPHCT